MRTTAQHVVRNAGARPAFTLLELLVTIGAVAVVAVGLAAVFGAVGDAVATGRRVSRMTQYSRMVESQLRNDFGSIDPGAFLVIRQQYADANGDGLFDAPTGPNDQGDDRVPIDEADEVARPRRVDEIIFFARGDFTSVRPALPDAQWIARSNAAMIYYGHGERLPNNQDDYADPKVNFSLTGNDANALGRADGINEHAAGWTLLRHATVLAPVPATPSLPRTPIYDLDVASATERFTLQDKDCQIAGQPAMSSIFRAINMQQGVSAPAAWTDTNPQIDSYVWYAQDTHLPVPGPSPVNYRGGGNAPRSPMLGSGVVDIATTSLDEVMRRLLGQDQDDLPDQYDATVAPPYATGTIATRVQTRDQSEVDVQHAWMDNAFPAPSAVILDTEWGTPYPSVQGAVAEVARGSRIRCEDRAVEVLGVIGNTGNSQLAQRESASTRADRLMLPMFSLAPGCTEFVVEWTFGQMDATGGLIWHGLTPPPAPAGVRQAPDAYPYDEDPNNGALRMRIPFAGPLRATDPQSAGLYTIPERLIYGNQIDAPGAAPRTDLLTLTSYFGQYDPVFNPDNASNTTFDPFTAVPPGSGGGAYGTRNDANRFDAAFARVEWPWPTQIRVRVTLVDPVDPKASTEQTFEYVFEVPKKNGT